jgi:hypothetical protein
MKNVKSISNIYHISLGPLWQCGNCREAFFGENERLFFQECVAFSENSRLFERDLRLF